MAATLSQSFGNPLMMALHLTESAGGAWECSWVPQPPHLHHWDALLLWVPRIRAWSQSLKQPLFLFDLIPPFIPMKVISLSLPLLLLSLYSVFPFSSQLLQFFQLNHCSLAGMGNSPTASAVKADTKLSLTSSASSSSSPSALLYPCSQHSH